MRIGWEWICLKSTFPTSAVKMKLETAVYVQEIETNNFIIIQSKSNALHAIIFLI